MTTTSSTGTVSSPWTVDSGTAVTNRNLVETSTKKNDQIDMNGFLKLMTTQLQHQDPFAPMDNNQMVAQMAQFSSLSSMAESNKLLNNISDSVSGGRLSDAAGWIGKSMLVESNIATPDRTGAYAGEFTLPSDSTGVSVDLVDGSGNVVKTLDLGARKAGAASFFWDGTNEAGEFVGGEPLKVQVRGAAPTQVATWASIAAVQSPAGGSSAKLITALGNFSPDDALRLG
jgi:flagellar basal-body rod modification protein FlgD